MEGAGHYGIFSGRRWREMVYPVVKDFIARNNPVATNHSAHDLMPEAALQVQAAPKARAVVKRPARKTAASRQG